MQTKESADEAVELYEKIRIHRDSLRTLAEASKRQDIAFGIVIESTDEEEAFDEENDFGRIYSWTSNRPTEEVVFRHMSQMLADDHLAKIEAAEQRLRELGFAPEAHKNETQNG